MSYTRTFVWAICPKCGTKMHLYGDYLEDDQKCEGCNTVWQLSGNPEDIVWEDRDNPVVSLESAWDRDTGSVVYIAPDDAALIPPRDGPFSRGH